MVVVVLSHQLMVKFDTSNVTDMMNIFYNCNSLEKIYAKTEADANRFRNSYGFPSQAEVIVV